MRTTIEIDDKRMKDALCASGAQTKREVVEKGLRTLVQLRAQEQAREFKGKMTWEPASDDEPVEATLANDEQMTIPEEIRDQLGLPAGAQLDVEIRADNSNAIRPMQPDARRIRGLLKTPQGAPPTVEQMDVRVTRHLQRKHTERR